MVIGSNCCSSGPSLKSLLLALFLSLGIPMRGSLGWDIGTKVGSVVGVQLLERHVRSYGLRGHLTWYAMTGAAQYVFNGTAMERALTAQGILGWYYSFFAYAAPVLYNSGGLVHTWLFDRKSFKRQLRWHIAKVGFGAACTYGQAYLWRMAISYCRHAAYERLRSLVPIF